MGFGLVIVALIALAWLLCAAPLRGSASSDEVTRLMERGREWLKEREYGNALDCFDAVLRLDPNNAYAFLCRGHCRHEKGDYAQAVEDFTEALRCKPRWDEALHGRGRAWLAQKEYDRAIRDFDGALRINPRCIAALWDRSAVWEQKEDWQLALWTTMRSSISIPARKRTMDERGAGFMSAKTTGLSPTRGRRFNSPPISPMPITFEDSLAISMASMIRR